MSLLKKLKSCFPPDFVEWEKEMTKQLHIITIAVILPKEAVYLGYTKHGAAVL